MQAALGRRKQGFSMRILHGSESVSESDQGAVLTIGNFDGVHRGHQALLASVPQTAREVGCRACLYAFEPHPRRFFRPDDPPFRLSSAATKRALLTDLGVDHVAVMRFDAIMIKLSDRFLRAGMQTAETSTAVNNGVTEALARLLDDSEG